jgi:predicted GNAT superfamily acetyltransferase
MRIEWVVCQVNLASPNAASDAFHAAMGYEEIGRAASHGEAKVVWYFERQVG